MGLFLFPKLNYLCNICLQFTIDFSNNISQPKDRSIVNTLLNTNFKGKSAMKKISMIVASMMVAFSAQAAEPVKATVTTPAVTATTAVTTTTVTTPVKTETTKVVKHVKHVKHTTHVTTEKAAPAVAVEVSTTPATK
jgi:hypothetical protein